MGVNERLGGLGGVRSARIAQLARGESTASRGARTMSARDAAGAVGRGHDRADVDFARAAARAAHDAERARAADAGLGAIGSLLGEVRQLVTDGGRQVEVDAVLADVDRVAGSTTYGDGKLLDGSAAVRGVALPAADAARLGSVRRDDRAYHVGDLRTGGTLAGAPSGLATEVVDAAAAQVARVRAALNPARPSGPYAAPAAGGSQLNLVA
ncbi:MAG TPA: hypothetical protein VEA69_03735 [Tepidisphaeraceae bacterium]|nr:hypothetical protein [Tepidisphaeraceae bacterium]